MIYHSNIEELHKHFPKVKVPPNEGIFRLGNTTDKLAFVILPENGGKPLHMSNGYPQEDFEREYVTILAKYYRYPPLTLDEDNNRPKGYASRIVSSEKSLRTRLVTTAIVQTFILLVCTLTILTTFLLARAESVLYICTAVFAVICLARIWSTTYSSVREVLNDKTNR